MALRWLPLAAAVGLCLLVASPAVSRRGARLTARFGLTLFGDYVAGETDRAERQRGRLRAAYVATPHRAYAARTLLYAGTLGVAGAVLGVYAAAGLLRALSVGEAAVEAAVPARLAFLGAATRLTGASPAELFLLLAASAATVGAAAAAGTYAARWRVLRSRAAGRASEIDATLPRTVAFLYALSRSGMPFPRVLDTLADNEAVYGEAARELAVAVRDINTFGTDVVTALERTADDTPSDRMAEFAGNLAAVLSSGRRVSTFLDAQYERFQEEAEAQQEQYLDLLAAFAESYVTVLVAGPLFMITLLTVIGLVLEDTLPFLGLLIYVFVPLGTVAFVVYVRSVVGPLGAVTAADRGEPAGTEFAVPEAAADDESRDGAVGDRSGASAGAAATDGGRVDRWAASRERLAAYDGVAAVRGWLRRPVGSLLERPTALLAVTVPLGLAWIGLSAEPGTAAALRQLRAEGIGVTAVVGVLEGLDVPFVRACFVVAGTYALVRAARKRRLAAVERGVPDFLDRLAQMNEAGATIVAGLRRVVDAELGPLGAEIERVNRDIRWGATVEGALRRLDRRAGSGLVSRTVALTVNAARASGDIAPVLSIAADESRATRRLRRERRAMMLTYLLVIYLSFLVFLGIIAALSVSFVPAIEEAAAGGGGAAAGTDGVPGGLVGSIGDTDVDVYQTLFLHAAIVQAVTAGLVAGQLGGGRLRDGAKHVTALLALVYAAAVLLGLT